MLAKIISILSFLALVPAFAETPLATFQDAPNVGDIFMYRIRQTRSAKTSEDIYRMEVRKVDEAGDQIIYSGPFGTDATSLSLVKASYKLAEKCDLEQAERVRQLSALTEVDFEVQTVTPDTLDARTVCKVVMKESGYPVTVWYGRAGFGRVKIQQALGATFQDYEMNLAVSP